MSVIEAISDKKNCDPMDFAPIGDSIDADALNRLIEGGCDLIEFTYAGLQIKVSGGEIALSPKISTRK